MKFLKQYGLIFILLILSCEQTQSQQAKPEKVYRIVYELHANDWYQKQAELWKKEIDKNPQNAEAWYNYYNANRYAYFENIDSKEKQKKLAQIIEDMGKAIPDSYEYVLLKDWNNCTPHDISLTEKAYNMRPDRPDTYYPLLLHYKVYGNKEKANEFCKKIYDSRDISPWLINYNYNVLMSLEENAFLFTNGDNDTYPIWMLQEVFGIRPDVTVLNISLNTIELFLENQLKKNKIGIDYDALKQKARSEEKSSFPGAFSQQLCLYLSENHPQFPIYFALTVYEKYTEPLKKDMFVVGLAFQYSKERIDNIAKLKKNLEKKFRLDYLKYDWYNESYPGIGLVSAMHMNYTLPALMLAEHYYTSGEQNKMQQWKTFALEIAEQAGKRDKISKYISDKGF